MHQAFSRMDHAALGARVSVVFADGSGAGLKIAFRRPIGTRAFRPRAGIECVAYPSIRFSEIRPYPSLSVLI